MNVSETLRAAAELSPHKTALCYGPKTISYGQLNDMAGRLAQALSQKGLRRGAPVMLMLHNSWEFVVSYFAIARLGAVTVPIDVRLKGDELSAIVTDSGAEYLITHQSLWEGSLSVLAAHFSPGRTILV